MQVPRASTPAICEGTNSEPLKLLLYDNSYADGELISEH